MRNDSLGFFWSDVDDKLQKKIDRLKEEGWSEVAPGYWCENHIIQDKELDYYRYAIKLENAYQEIKSKASAKCQPPEPVWLKPDYLPHYKEAKEFKVDLFTDNELIDAVNIGLKTGVKPQLIFDIECYPNYFLIAFRAAFSSKIIYFELAPKVQLDIPKLAWIVENFTLVGFYSEKYDIPMLHLALAGHTNSALEYASSSIVAYTRSKRKSGLPSWKILKQHKIQTNKNIDHIDLAEVAPLSASLKIYGGRLHSARMQDLPFPPNTALTHAQITCTRWYCVNDLAVTLDLHTKLKKELALRVQLGSVYGLDLRSKSDAQIAEAVITKKVQELKFQKLQKPQIPAGTRYYYDVPKFIKYRSELMQYVLNIVGTTPFVVNNSGKIDTPEALKKLEIKIGSSAYTIGIGGLHSCEKQTMHVSDENYILADHDVISYYPIIILNLLLYPPSLGIEFLKVYRAIVEERIEAKMTGDSVVASTLKIVINGSFGKLSQRFSMLYSPDLLIQVTLTGQLSLLLLIERLEMEGIGVISANTDGIVVKCPRNQMNRKNAIIKEWEKDTGFDTEESLYKTLLSRDVNNYIAIKSDTNSIKSKGVFSRPGLNRNPTNEICLDAMEQFLLNSTPIKDTIRKCNDIRKFVTVRTVKGGAVKDGEFLGKAIRWYYAEDTTGTIIYAGSGNKVPRSDGAKPLMDIPSQFPNDINYEWYEKETWALLEQIGYAA